MLRQRTESLFALRRVAVIVVALRGLPELTVALRELTVHRLRCADHPKNSCVALVNCVVACVALVNTESLFALRQMVGIVVVRRAH